MATTVYLLRHAAHALLDRVLVGRGPVELSAMGREQAQALGQRFVAEKIARVQASPQTRARQTAQPIADPHLLMVETVSALDEIDLGTWTGRSFEELKNDPQWQLWNANRECARAPGGETMHEVQARMLQHLTSLREQCPEGKVVVVSHGDPIRAALLHYHKMSLNDFGKLTVDPASVTTVLLHESGGEIIGTDACSGDCVAA